GIRDFHVTEFRRVLFRSSGPAIEPGKPEESLLIEAINYASYEMPPSGKLKDADIAVLTEWVRMGAPWPGGDHPVPIAKPRGVVKIGRASCRERVLSGCGA